MSYFTVSFTVVVISLLGLEGRINLTQVALPFNQLNCCCSVFLLAGYDFNFQSLGIIKHSMLNIVSYFIN